MFYSVQNSSMYVSCTINNQNKVLTAYSNYLFKSILIPEIIILFNLLIKQLVHPKKGINLVLKVFYIWNEINYFAKE